MDNTTKVILTNLWGEKQKVLFGKAVRSHQNTNIQNKKNKKLDDS